MRSRSIRVVLALVTAPLLASLACSSDEGGGGSSADDAGSGGASGGTVASGGAGAAGEGGNGAGGASAGGSAGAPAGGASSPMDAGADAGCEGYLHPISGECHSPEVAFPICIAEALEAQPSRRADRLDCDLGCFCDRCVQVFGNCGHDPECRRILICASETGCTGLDCYHPSTCQTVIDDVGGVLGDAGKLATSFLNCQQSQGCALTCEDDAGGDGGGGSATDASADATVEVGDGG